MSVCFVPGESASPTDDGDDSASSAKDGGGVESSYALAQFWEKVMEDVRQVTADDFKQQVLPLARIKRIMKLDDEVKMISAEAPLLFAKAAEIFIHELTLRAWIHTEENKRRTLQKNDIGSAAADCDQYDFLIDFLPPEDFKHSKPKEEQQTRATVSPDQVQYYLQLAQQHQAALQQPQVSGSPIQTQATAAPQVVQMGSPSSQTQQQPQQSQNLQLLQQVITPNGEVQHIPIQLSQNQMNLIRMQMQSGSNQPILIQTGPMSGQPQIIQINPQQQPHSVYLTQVSAVPEGEMIT